MQSHFDSEFFKENRRNLKTLFTGKAPIILSANGLLQRSNDTAYPFRQDSNLWYLTGIDEPNVVLVMDKDNEYLIVPDLNSSKMLFDGTINKEQLMARSGIKDLVDEKTGWQQLHSRIKKVKHVATLAPSVAYDERYGIYTNPAQASLIRKIKKINPEINLLDLRQHFGRLRVIKQPQELAAIRQAISVTMNALHEVSKRLQKYEYEYQIEADLMHEFRRQNVGIHAYEPIIASGVNACTLHYIANNSLVNSGPILIDVGAEVEHYAADITRTYPIGEFTKRQEAVYQAVKDVQDFAYELLKPGTIFMDYEKQVHDFMGEKLRTLGLIKVINKETVLRYFPHSISHYLGLDVHDIGDYSQPLKPGVVITVEPGIYIPEENLGIRIEDDVLITEDGIEILSKKTT